MQAPRQNFDIMGQAFKRNPFPVLSAMRESGPVVRTKIPILGRPWFAVTHAACIDLLKSPEFFVVDARNAGKRSFLGIPWMPKTFRLLAKNMLSSDDPDHRRLRGIVDRVFHRTSIDKLRPQIETIADRLLDDFERSDDRDLVTHFARPLPLRVICEMLGLPEPDIPQFMRWMDSMTNLDSVLDLFRIVPSVRKMNAYLRATFEERRRRPGDDLVSELVHIEQEGDCLSQDELLAMCFLLFAAGHETTTHLISGSVLALLQHPRERVRLQQDRALAPAAVDEMLRFVSPVQMTKPRFATRDMTFHGVALHRGEMIFAMLAAANSDPAVFDAPETLDIARKPNRHLAFGSGPHICLGMQLARLEAQVALEKLFARYPGLGLAVRDEDISYARRGGLRALSALPLELEAQDTELDTERRADSGGTLRQR